VAELEKISSSEYAIDGNLSRFVGMPRLRSKSRLRGTEAITLLAGTAVRPLLCVCRSDMP
jgi:hypothetical protein